MPVTRPLPLFLTAIYVVLLAGSAPAQVTIQAEGKVQQIHAAAYQATVGADGSLTSLTANGVQFLTSADKFPRGAYLYQGGLLPLANVQRKAADTVTAQSDKATVIYRFIADGIKIELTNASAEKMEYVFVLDEGVSAVRGDRGRYHKAPTTRDWAESTWFQGTAWVRITGTDRVWGPWSGKHQVLTTTIAPRQTQKIVVTVGRASAEEQAQAAAAVARIIPPPTDPTGPMWDMKALSAPPRTFPAPGFSAPGVRALFYQGPDFEGESTRVFAWVALPQTKPGQKVPGMVLVHGGGGTAFADWVRLWTARGYAAIAMDTCGCVPRGRSGHWQAGEFGGPAGWGGFGQINWPRQDQWTYHAVADAILANSLLRSLPQVDPDRIGLTGISWGGYLTCIIAGVDHRFKFAVPVYGCGFTLDTLFGARVRALGQTGAARWLRWWDPSVYLPHASLPMLWVAGSNDFAYTLQALQESYRLAPGPRTLCVRLRMPHGQGPGQSPEEIPVFADSILRGGKPLARITGQGREGKQVWATYKSEVPVVKAELNYTKDRGHWQDRKWDSLPAHLDPQGRVTAELPDGVTVYYLNLVDSRGLVVSTEHEELTP